MLLSPMSALAWLLAAALAWGATAGAGTPPLPPSQLLAQLNQSRAAAGRPLLAPHPALADLAQQRAAEMAAAGSLTSQDSSVVALSRQLLRRGYRAETWSESAFWGSGDVLSRWRTERREAWQGSVLGDFTELGVGVAVMDGEPLYVLLFALPRAVAFERRAAPLRQLPAVRLAVLESTNGHRQERGRPPLAADPLLDRVAQAHAESMLARGFYDHRDPDGRQPEDRLRLAGFRARRSGENIAKGLFEPREVVERWMASSGHRSNLLDRGFTLLGVGVAVSAEGGLAGESEEGVVVWVQLFAAPR